MVDFFDQLKSRTQGYASLDYEPAGYQAADLVKVDVLLNGVTADAFSTIVHKDRAYDYGRRMTWAIVEGVSLLFLHISRGKKSIVRETVE